jgi:hypothetical protein
MGNDKCFLDYLYQDHPAPRAENPCDCNSCECVRRFPAAELPEYLKSWRVPYARLGGGRDGTE